MNYFEKIPKNNYGFIYKYTSPSGKSYIGQTIRSLKERAGKNGTCYKNCSVFYKAIQKYGLENFKIEILYELPKDQLDEKEKEMILLYDTLVPHGYNYYPGGCGKKEYFDNKHAVDEYDLEGKYIKTYESLKEAAQEKQIPWQAISQCIRKEIEYYKDRVYVYSGEPFSKPKKIIKTHGRKIAQYDLDGNFIQEFQSANQAARAIGKNSNAGRNIRSACSGSRKSAYGYRWEYLD